MQNAPTTENAGADARTNLERVTLSMREMILSGDLAAGSRVREAALAERLGVSRTPVRLALNILEQEGLLIGESRRGFRVKTFSLDEVLDAIEVRGTLEGLAARLIVERGGADKVLPALTDCLADEARILAKGSFEESDTGLWKEVNARFHAAIVEHCGNDALFRSLRVNDAIPLAAAGAIAFNTTLPDLGFRQLHAAHEDHERIVDAFSNGEGARVQALLCEHAQRSKDNKRQTYTDLASRRDAAPLPGAELVIVG